MEAVDLKLEHLLHTVEFLLPCEEIPVVRLKSYAINAFVMGYHVYKENWIPSIIDELQRLMEPTNKLDKYAVAVREKYGDVIGHLPLGKPGKFAKTVFYFLKSDKNHHCKVHVTGKGTNVVDGLGMKVPCQLFLLAEEKFIITLQEKLSKLL